MMRKITSYLLFFLVLVSLFAGLHFSPFNNTAIAPANSTNTLGYEFLDSGAVVRIWNDYDSYYFNVSNGMQFSNHYQEYWTHNVMMLGYYAGSTWNLLYRTDELSGFEKTIDLTEDYCNATLWKDLTYAGYSFRLAIRYSLGVNDNNLTVIPYIKNLGIDIPYQLAFGWEMKDIQVDGDIYNDYIKIDDTQYFLDQSLDNTYTGLADSKFYLVDDTHSSLGGKVLYLDWDSSLEYLVTVKSRDGQYNAPVTLFIKAGTLASGQEKYTKMYWWDSAEDLTTFTEHDATNYFTETTTTCSWTNLPGNADNHTVYKNYGTGYFYGNMIFKFELQMTSSIIGLTHVVPWLLSNKLDDWTGQTAPFYGIYLERNGVAASLYMALHNGVAEDASSALSAATTYYLTVIIGSVNIVCNIYSDSARTTLVDTLSVAKNAGTYKYLFCGASFGAGAVATSTGFVRFFNISRNFNITTLPASNIKATSSNLRGQIDTQNQTGRMWFKYGLTLAYGTYTAYQYAPVNASTIYNQSIKGLTPGKLYHYRAIGNNNTKTINGSDAMFLTKPEAPTSIHYSTINSTAINITWTKGVGANRTVIVKKTGSVPTSQTDGTVIYNNTGTYYNYTTATNVFIQMWGYDKWINGSTTLYQFSDNASIYFVFINCYRETNGSPITNYTVFFSNPAGTSTYMHYPCNNPFAISVGDIPQGNDISLIVNRTGYSTRTYVFDIEITENYYINVYLTTNNTLYLLTVIDELGQPISDAKVTISKYINATAGFKNVSIIYTDGAGQLTVYLQPFKLYKFYITHASGTYQDEISDWTTSDQLFTHTFMMRYLATPTQPEYIEIVFTGGRGGTTIFANYTDAMAQTIDATIWLYRINSTMGNLTLMDMMTYSSTNTTINYVFLGSNASCDYKLYLFFNHTSYGSQARMLIFEKARTALTTPNRINTLLDAIIGHAGPFLWQNVIMFLFFMVMMFSIDKKDAGKGLMLIGGIFIFVSMIGFTDVFSTAGRASIPALFIIVGLATEWINSRRNY
jgi:hypothetical protein